MSLGSVWNELSSLVVGKKLFKGDLVKVAELVEFRCE